MPNFSEGRDRTVIDRIAGAITSVEGIKLLNVDMGFDTNRTVVTFAGDADIIVEAAFRGMSKAAEYSPGTDCREVTSILSSGTHRPSSCTSRTGACRNSSSPSRTSKSTIPAAASPPSQASHANLLGE